MKMKNFLILFIIFFVFFPYIGYSEVETSPSAIAFGVKEVKTLDMYFGYLSKIVKNTWGNVTLNFTPIDGVDKIIVANIRVVVEQSSSCTFEIRVNNTPCRTSNITSYITGKVQYVADFDCTNVINKSGTYMISLRPSEDVYNTHFRAWITYENNPESQVNTTLNYLIQNITQTIIQNINSSRDYIIQNITSEINTTNSILNTINQTLSYLNDNIFNISNIIIQKTDEMINLLHNIISIIIEKIGAFEDIDIRMLSFDGVPTYTRKYCMNDTLVIERISNITIGNKTYPYLRVDKIECDNGCDPERKECNHPKWIYYMIILGVIIIIYLCVKFVILPLIR